MTYTFMPVHTSKHRAKPGKGRVRFSAYTGLRKLARAMCRGLVPPERQFTINMAEEKASFRTMLRGMEKNPT